MNKLYIINKSFQNDVVVDQKKVVIKGCYFKGCSLTINCKDDSIIEIENNEFLSPNPINININCTNKYISIVIKYNKFVNSLNTFTIAGKELSDEFIACDISYNVFKNKEKIRYITNFKKEIPFIHSNVYLLNDLNVEYDNKIMGIRVKYNGFDSAFKTKFKSEIELEDYLHHKIGIYDVEESKLIIKKLPVISIPQYLSFENDPAINTGCEATAIAILLSYLLNKKITKNEVASCMPRGLVGYDNFWEVYLGDFENGFGCMATVTKKTIEYFLNKNGLLDKYDVVNLTGVALTDLFSYIENNIPVIVWASMGDDDTMFKRIYGSTKWVVNGKNLWWTGNEHSLVLTGVDENSDLIFVADPEQNNEFVRQRNLFLFNERYISFYSQAIVVIDKMTKKR